MIYYVVLYLWQRDYETDVEVLGIKSSMEEAKALLATKKEERKKDANERGWKIYEDQSRFYEAGSPDEGGDNLWIKIVRE